MIDLTDASAEGFYSSTFMALPLASPRLTDAPDCVRKSCCKKYKRGKRCKSCPKK